MKQRIVGLLLLCLLAAAAAGCAGREARTHILIPSMEVAWPGVRADAERGGAAAEDLEAMDLALESRDNLSIVSAWPEIRAAAEAGIQARLDEGEVSPGVATSLRRRLTEFDEAVQEIARRPY